jgi:hypothetical protein
MKLKRMRIARARYAGPLAASWMFFGVSAAAPPTADQDASSVGSVSAATDLCSNQMTPLFGEVHTVFGPRLFTVAAPGTGIHRLVFVPGWHVAAVRTGLPLCIVGTITPTLAANLDQEWGSFARGPSPAVFPTTLIAEQVTSRGVDIVVSAAAPASWPNTAAAADHTVTDADLLANSTDTKLVGRFVSLRDVRITAVVSPGGFWIASDHEELFVLSGDDIHPRTGQRVNLKGVVLQLPDGMTNRLGDYRAARDEVIYVYASQFRTL